MSEREKPDNADAFGWDEFEELADSPNGSFGTDTGDWMAWWEVWKAGYTCAIDIYFS